MKLTQREIVGIILWWAEGTKSRRDKRWKSARSFPIELTNTNPAIIKVFVDFLREDLGVSAAKLKLQLQIHEGDNQEELESYWEDVTGIPRNMCQKTIVRPIGRKVGKTKGTCKVRFSDKLLYLQLESLLARVLAEVYKDPQLTLRTLPHYEFTV